MINHSHASARTTGSSMSRSQKNIQPHDLKPVDVLIERFINWKAIVQQLTAYFECIADIESNTAKELTNPPGIIQVPFRAGNQFLGEGGLQDVFYNIRGETRIIVDQHADFGRTVDSRSIVEHLQKLRAEIKAHIKNVQHDTGKLASGVAKEREISTRLVGELANDVSAFKNTPMSIPSKNDPYIANQAVGRQLQCQVLEENLLQKSIVMMQQNSVHFEEGIVRSIQSARQMFDEWQSRASPASQDKFRSLSTYITSLAPEHEWIQFAARSDHVLDLDTPLRDPKLISYPLKNHPSVFPVHTGHMERKKRFKGVYVACYFVLTPAGFLHEFATADPNSPDGLVPTFSLFLPNCTLGPVSPPHSKNHKFHIEGRKDGLGTTKSKSGSLGRGGDEGYEGWSFRLRSREDMLEWWNDIGMMCARYLASEQAERTGPGKAAVRTAGHAKEESEPGEAGVIRGEMEGWSSVEEKAAVKTIGDAEDHAPPVCIIPEKHDVEIGPNRYAIEKKYEPGHHSINLPCHGPFNVGVATMDVALDEPRRSRRLRKRQMEKAPEGIEEDHRRRQQQQQGTGDRSLPPPVPFGGAPSVTTSPTGSRSVTTDGHGNVKKGVIIPNHVGSCHVSSPPHGDTENDGEEAVTHDNHEKDENENDDIYADDRNRDVGDHVHPTESAAPENGGGAVVSAVGGTGEPTAQSSTAGDLHPNRLDGKELEAITTMTTDGALMQTSPNPEFKVLERRIQTLTSILQKMKRRHSPTSDRSQVPAFLRHFATLLTYDDEDDVDAKRVIAVTGSLTGEELRTLVVTQNPFGFSQVSEFGAKEIVKSNGTFEEVVNGDKSSKLSKHISDVWAVIDSYDPNVKDQFNSFCHFIVTRCFRKLAKRVSQDKRWGVSVSRKIYVWSQRPPLNEELDNHRWIKRPVWAVQLLPPGGIDGMKEREVQEFGQPVIEWEFSAATLRSWAWLLAKILQQVELAIRATKVAQEKKLTDQEIRALKGINIWCHRLCAYVHWKEDVVKTLLTKTSLAHAFNLHVLDDDAGDAEPDEPADRREPGESEGQQVLCHLQAIVAWHAAAKSLLNKKHHHVTCNLHVGLVEVSPTKSDNLMTDEEVIQEFFHRQPASSPEAYISIGNIIRENHPKKFTGTIHAEATLMGLLTCFSPGSSSIVCHGNLIDEASICLLRELIVPATFEKAIAVDKKCCWFCNRLSSLLGGFKLPGSHGILYSWTPPRVGVDIIVLQALENELWDEMVVAIGDLVYNDISCESSGSSTVLEDLELEDEDFNKATFRAVEW